MNRCGPIVLMLAASALAACQKPRPPGVYDVSVADAYQRLSTNALPDMVYAKQCGILIHVIPEGVPNQQVTWRVYSSDQEVVQFTAVLTPVSEKQTKVDIIVPAAPDGGEVYDGSKFYTRPAFQQPLRPVVAEQVGAILEGRKFDVTHVGPGTDRVCMVQRGGLETGVQFSVNDPPDKD